MYQCCNVDERKRAVDRLRKLKADHTYTEMVEMTGVNRKELCKMVNISDYEPPAWVWVKLGVHVFELAPVCPVHGTACTVDCSTEKVVPKEARVYVPHGTNKKRNRRAVNLDDPVSAAMTIRNAGTTEAYRRELARELMR